MNGQSQSRPGVSFVRVALILLSILLAGPAPARAATLKIATLAPDGTGWMKQMRAGALEVSRRTEGRVKFKFYPGGVMGNDKTVRRKIRIGQLQGGALTGGVLGDVYPDSQLYSLPMLFDSYPEMDYVRAHMDRALAAGLEQGGFVTFGLSEGGFAYIMSREPVRGIGDLRQRKVWVPEGDQLTRSVFENMGVTPIPLPVADVYTGLQTGLIDTVGISPIGAIAFQWHTQVKYVTDTPLMYIYGVLAIEEHAFKRLKPADQKIVRDVMGKVFAELNRQNRIDNTNAKQALHRQGLTFVKIKAPELRELQASVAQARAKMGARGYYTKEMYEILQGHLSAFRNHHRATVR